MNKERRILMCLQQLDIGGVETAVLTLCKGYIRAGCKVFVAAKRGLFNEQLEKLGINFLELDYEIKNNYVLDKKEELIKYCKKEKITEIHIHQYPCVIYWLPVIMELKIPYVAYVHSIIPGAPEWFMETFPVYKTALPIFFENASKIVCISEKTKNDINNLFNLSLEKYLVIPNSLNMEDFTSSKKFTSIKTFGLISRLSEEKMPSIKCAIDFFNEYAKDLKNAKFLIAGDGPMLKKIKEYIGKNKNIELIGSISNSAEFLNDIDIYMGLDRTILEAMACKKLAIIASYKGSLTLIDKDTINLASLENFSGNNLEETANLSTILKNITTKEYEDITQKNYEFINKKYNVDNNLYKDSLNNNYSNEYNRLFETINNYLQEIDTYKYELYYKKENTLFKRIKRFIKRWLNKIKRIFN